VQRIYIAGGAGAGKTTLGREVARRLGVVHCDWDRGQLPDRVAGGAWVVEGAHLWAIEPFLESADVIVWLDVPVTRTIPRIVLRHVRLSARGRNPHPGVWKLVRFVARQPFYYLARARAPRGPTDWDALTRAQTRRTLDPHRDRVIRLRRPAQVRRWLETLDSAHA
jgi:shikimate kinase